MDKYEVIGFLGEGSFGRVYKAKQLSSGQFVALKVISKRGRSTKEIKDLRGECEIQRKLNHPNIIQMLDSFETENEIVVITEFAHKELNTILGKEGYLSEDRVQAIVWDLVSALYYLHSHRVLHRDLKPQNILLDAKNRAKLCDFGFARNMSTGTHVLTSIKGTPLYMAPELIDELPYDHNADLWSLGCIIYELLVGAPPFCTASILHLVRLIRHEQVQWPTFLGEHCISFLKGLLQKDPKKRLSWNEILNHPFVKGHILISDNDAEISLTRPMSSNTMHLKDQQRKEYINQKTNFQHNKSGSSKPDEQKKVMPKGSKELKEESKIANLDTSEDLENNNPPLNEKMNNLSLESKKGPNKSEECQSSLKEGEKVSQGKGTMVLTDNLIFIEDCQPIETEEWIVFLQKSIEEIINGELVSLTQQNLTNILVSPLRNSNSSSKVLVYVAKLFSIPFVIRAIPAESLELVKKVYLEVKLVPNLVNSTKLLLRQKVGTPSSASSSSSSQLFTPVLFKSIDDLTEDDLECLEYIFLLISHLVYLENEFLVHFCDAIAVLNVNFLLHLFFKLAKKRLRVTLDVVAILTHILRNLPENCELVEKVIAADYNEKDPINFVNLLRHENLFLRERICYFLLYLGRCSPKCLESIWNDNVKETLEALVYDSMESVRNAAEKCIEELKVKEFYY